MGTAEIQFGPDDMTCDYTGVMVVVYKTEKKICVSLGQGVGKEASKMYVYFKKASVCHPSR